MKSNASETEATKTIQDQAKTQGKSDVVGEHETGRVLIRNHSDFSVASFVYAARLCRVLYSNPIEVDRWGGLC
jgi:hypothetical protein